MSSEMNSVSENYDYELAVAARFQLEGTPIKCRPHGEGHINKTFRISTDCKHHYILQKINNQIFRDVEALMHNISSVTAFLKAKEPDPRRVQTIVPAKDGKSYLQVEDGSYWRVYEYIEHNLCLQLPECDEDFFQTALAFGGFQNLLADFPADTLYETIPNFHDTPNRYRNFLTTLELNPENRAKDALPEIEFALARQKDAPVLTDRLNAGELPLKVTHNDTKQNNVLLDKETREALCVIDLDTIMPGLAAYDFGDSIRFGASTAAEDEPDLDKVHFDYRLYEIYTKGFLTACPALTDAEKRSLPWGARLMTLECGVRFLTDYLDGDHYFHVSKPDHNLLRARTQFKLVYEMEANWDKMTGFVEQFIEK